jgi:phenylalanyl-tRNA synthetase beta chain
VDDIVNYVIYEYGQYLKIYDYDRLLQVNCITSSVFLENTIGVFYNGKLTSTVGYIITDLFSVTRNSVNIVVESLLFNSTAIFNNLQYYEKQDYFLSKVIIYLNIFCQNALKKTTFLITNLTGGFLRNILTIRDKVYLERKFIILKVDNINKILGLLIDPLILSYFFLFHNIRFIFFFTIYYVNVPFYRLDIINEIDLIGSFIRFYGINKIVPINLSYMSSDQYYFLDINLLSIGNFLRFKEYNEVVTYSFIDISSNALFLSKGVDFLEVSNPISKDMSVLRVSLLPGLLKVVQYNQNRQCDRLRLFEVGTKFYFDQEDYFLKQKKTVAGLCVGSVYIERWCTVKGLVDFFDIKNDVENLCLYRYGNILVEFVKDNYIFLDTIQNAAIYIGGKKVGFVGLLCSSLLQKFKIKYPVFCFEVDLEVSIKKPIVVFKQFSKQPYVRRDLSVVVEKGSNVGLMLSFLRSNGGCSLINVIIFDVYYNYSEKDKSVSFGLFFQHDTQTLTEDVINYNVEFILNLLYTKFGGVLRCV